MKETNPDSKARLGFAALAQQLVAAAPSRASRCWA